MPMLNTASKARGKAKENILNFIKGTDKLLLFLCVITSLFGILSVVSATHRKLSEGSLISHDAVVMIAAVSLGIILALLISLIDYDIICRLWPLWAALGILLILLVMVVGVGPANRPDSKLWLDLKFFYFQPSELVKIFFIISFSAHLSSVLQELNKIKVLIPLAIHALFPVLLIMKSGDDGSALVFIFIAAAMLFTAGLSYKLILCAAAVLTAFIPLVWVKLSDFQKARFIVIVNPDFDRDTAYQQMHGLTAVSNGGFFGTGFLKGPCTQSGYVPVCESDMILTVIAEEAGLVGAIAALALIAAVIFRILKNGSKALTPQARLMSCGLAAMIASQTLINAAMCLRIGPVIGITLPFFSAGGSSSLCLYIGLGLAFGLYRSSYAQKPVSIYLTKYKPL